MRTVFTTLAAVLIAGTAAAESSSVAEPMFNIGGDIELKIEENTAGDYAAKTTLGLGVTAGQMAYGGFNVEAVDSNTFTLDEWHMGVQVDAGSVSVGKQGDIWIDAPSAIAHNTLADMTMDESVQARLGGLSVAMEFGDVKNDVSDIEAVAGSYTLTEGDISATGAIDYDLDAKTYTLGGRVDVAMAGGAVTKAEGGVWAYEVDGSMGGITAYLNGNEDDMARNIGANYSWNFDAITVKPEVNYDLDASELSPSMTMSFSF